MEFDPEDQDIVRLLTTLKNTEGEYPEHMFVARRHMYLKRMAEIGMGIGAGTGIEEVAKSTNPAPVAPTASTLLETALVVAIIVETSAVAYFYRHELADFFQTITTDARVQEVTPLPVVTTATEIQGVTPSPAVTATIPSAVLSASPTELIVPVTDTPIPGVADEPGNGADDNNVNNSSAENNGNNSPSNGHGGTTVDQPDSTPVPNVNNGNNNNNGNQGNHYGQTPKPERTKENNGNNDTSPAENNSEAPGNNDAQSSNDNDSQPPQNEPKPTKAK